MRVLIVASYNAGKFSSFITEQVEAIRQLGVEVDYFGIVGKGIIGYLRNLPALRRKIKQFKPEIVHAHFGLSGLFANLQRKVPVVTTYHGCDINVRKLRILSLASILLSRYNIFVSKSLAKKVRNWSLKKAMILTCGVNLDLFVPKDKYECRKIMNLPLDKKIVLFSSSFSRPEKNSQLAFSVVEKLDNVQLVELNGYSREEVVLMMNAADVGLLTSFRESAPLFLKEMTACHRPVVSTPVGDVSEILDAIEGSFISAFDEKEMAKKVSKAMTYDHIIPPDTWALRYDNKIISKKLVSLYLQLIPK